MTDQHPITPPPELVQKWVAMLEYCEDLDVFTDIAQWGANQELEACCEWLKAKEWIHPEFSDELRAARRPKLSNLKEQAQLAIDTAVADGRLSPVVSDVVRRALEQLDD